MTAVAAPFGARASWHPSGNANATAYPGGIASGYASNIYNGSPVILNTSGNIIIGTTAADILGIFDGVEYTDSNGRRQYSKTWPANLVATEIVAYVYDDPLTRFDIQCNGSLAQTAIGDQADFVNPGNGNATTGVSTAAISSTLAGAGVQAQLRILQKQYAVDNDWGDAFTVVTVQIARQQYVANKVAI